jgi:hypothetical protein
MSNGIRRAARQRDAAPYRQRKAGDDVATKTRFRAVIFNCGDCLFLIMVGVAATWIMHLIHHLGWHIAFTLPVGMVAAMLAQMLLASFVAPILGSIESMVPSMVVAMIIPMMVCTFDLVGISLNSSSALLIGAGGGIAIFFLLRLYAIWCQKSLCAEYKSK